MMFKRNALAFAVLAVASGATFAAGVNESVIGQYDGLTSIAQVEQGTVDGEGQFAQIVQQTPDTSNARIFQGNTTDVGVLLTSDLSPQIPNGLVGTPQDLAVAAAIAHLYDPANTPGNTAGAVANYATIIQDTTANSVASVYQVNSVDDDLTTMNEAMDLSNTGTIDVASGDVTVTDGVTSLTLAYTVGDFENSGGSANNIGFIYQGAVVSDRDGNALGTNATGDGADGELALVVQSGVNHIAQIFQSGDAQTAGIFQEGDANDGFIAQFDASAGNTALIGQMGSYGYSTIYQSGGDNTAIAFQYAAL